ncbi:hypothetical protein BH11VER1_BH11VER1_01250 [soil metagenome]
MKTTLIALTLAILVSFTFTSCKSTSGGMHNMGGPKPSYPMSNESMTRTR